MLNYLYKRYKLPIYMTENVSNGRVGDTPRGLTYRVSLLKVNGIYR